MSPLAIPATKPRRKKYFWVALVLGVGAVASTIPLFVKTKTTTATTGTMEKTFQPRPAKLSGVVTLKDSCQAGYYQIRLQGLETTQIQVDAQTDQSGHFSLVAPPGQYMMTVNKAECGSTEKIVLEENTEHMLAVSVQETKQIEKSGKMKGRLPASVLILPNRVK